MALCNGGSNDITNFQALCPPCHAKKTQEERCTGKTSHTIESQLSVHLWTRLHKCPKPREVSWGVFTSTDKLGEKVVPRKLKPQQAKVLENRLQFARKTYQKAVKTHHVKDVLLKKTNPRTTCTDPVKLHSRGNVLSCMDAKSCRVNAIVQRDRGLPIFSPLDEEEEFRVDCLVDADFVYVDTYRAVDGEDFPYTGSRFYAAEVVQYMLRIGVIREEDCKASLTASRHIHPDQLNVYLESIRRYVMDACYDHRYEQFEANSICKSVILSLIGLWNCTETHAWKRTTSMYQTDAGKNVKMRRDMGDGSYDFLCSVEVVSLSSMAPWGKIALDKEQMLISMAIRELKRHHELTVVGAHVDGVYFLRPYGDNAVTEEVLNAHRFPSGEPMFQLKENEPVGHVPTCAQNAKHRVQELTFESPKWERYEEMDLGENLDKKITQLFLDHGGLLLTGAAGVGKSYIAHWILARLKLRRPGRKQLVMALRHCAAMLICGKTIQHYIMKYEKAGGSPAAGTIVLIDESSEIQLHTWAVLAKWKLMGVNFIIMGDFDGQLKPIFDSWQDAMKAKDIRTSRFLHELAGGLHVKLSKYRRGIDPKLFQDYTGLYKYADEPDPEVVQLMVEKVARRYSAHDGEYSIHLTTSHRKRVVLNSILNKIVASQKEQKLFVESCGAKSGDTMVPQDMWIWPGMELICYSQKYAKKYPVSGAVYTVEEWGVRKGIKVVAVRLHESYIKTYNFDINLDDDEDVEATAPLVAGEAEKEVDSDPEDLGEDDDPTDDEVREPPMKRSKVSKERGVYTLSLQEVSRYLRPQHALVYASIQGRTFRDEHYALLDWHHLNFTMRHLIVSMSRATHGKFVHVLTEEQELQLLEMYRERVRELDG